jgi:hypothetical protein
MGRIASGVLLVALVAACSREDAPGTPPAPGCQLSFGLCVVGGTTQSCTAAFGTWVDSGCPAASRLGTCVGTGTSGTEITHYYAPYWTEFTAEASCEGAWATEPSPPPPPPPPGTGGEVVSCTLASAACVELIGASPAQQAELQADCAPAPYYVWAESHCALGGAVPGYCEFSPAPGITARLFYSSASYTLEEAQADCGDLGAWVN